MGMVAVAALAASTAGDPNAQIIATCRWRSARHCRQRIITIRYPADFDVHVAAVVPAQMLEPLEERRHDPRSNRRDSHFFQMLATSSAYQQRHEHANTPHALGLLRLRRERPRECPAAEQRYEFAV
jgi:hypothetical protein